jgi:hypothetical protein
VGKAFALEVGTILYHKIGRAGPFILMGSSDLVFTVFILLMVFLRLFGNLPKKD